MKTRLACAVSMAAAFLAGCGGNDASPTSSVTAPTLAASVQMVRGQSALEAKLPPASFQGKLADYSIVRSAGNVIVTEKAGARATVTLTDGTTLLFADATVATDPNGVAPKAYRLYQAAFDRAPDAAGLGFQISAMEGLNLPLEQIARGFVDSPEFSTRYGQLDNTQFVTQLYRNVLHREPEPAGLKFYVDFLNAGTRTRAEVLGYFSESPENTALVAGAIAHGVSYIPYVVAGGGSASAANGATPKLFWRADATLDVVLRDARGTPVPGARLSCVAADPAVLTVASNCRSASGQRLGIHEVIVSGSGASARLAVQVMPQRVALGIAGNTEHYGVATGADGHVYAWGYNSSRQLGQGNASSTDSNVPLLVRNSDGTAALGGIVAAIGGEYNSLGLTEDGRLYGWGGGAHLARPSGHSTLPALIRNPANNGSLASIVQAAVGEDNAVALTDDGRVLTWGSHPGQGWSGDSDFPNQPRLASGAPLTDMVQVAAGWNFGLALGADGRVYGWGWNSTGQTGRGTADEPELFAAPVLRAADNAPIDNIVAISAGYNMAMALRADGQVYIWGSNDFHQAGQGTEIDEYSKAVLLKNSAGTGPMTNIVMVSSGGIYGLALDNQGRVYSWGQNNDGELGVGTARDIGARGLPGPVIGSDGLGQLSDIVSIAAGDSNAYALRRDGTVLAWGSGFGGAPGIGIDVDNDLHVPTPVAGLGNKGKLVLNLAAYPNLTRRAR